MRVFAVLIGVLVSLAGAAPALSQPAPSAPYQCVLLVSIDGARPDGLRASNVGPLLDEATYTMNARTTVPPVTAPSHMSMVSGVGPERHGVRTNLWRPGAPYPTVPTAFSEAKRAGMRTGLFTQKSYVMGISDPRYLDRSELVPARAATMTPDLVAAVGAFIRTARPHFTLAHISEPDFAGHAQGWMSFAYLQALRRAVAGIAALRQSLRDAGIEEQCMVIVTADHGGIGRDHVELVPEVLTIPWLAIGRGTRKGFVIERPIVIYDTAATALQALGLPVPQGWDGRPVVEAFAAGMGSPVAVRP